MTIRGEITYEDYRQYFRASAREQIKTFSAHFLAWGIVLSSFSLHFDWSFAALIGGFSLVIGSLALLPGFFSRAAKERFLEVKNLQGLRRIEMNADGIAFSSPTVNFTERWEKHFRTYSVVPGLTVLYEAGYDFQLFPRRWFTDEQYAEFQAWLRDSLGKP